MDDLEGTRRPESPSNEQLLGLLHISCSGAPFHPGQESQEVERLSGCSDGVVLVKQVVPIRISPIAFS